MTTTEQEVKKLKADLNNIKSLLEDQLDENVNHSKISLAQRKQELENMAEQAGKNLRSYLSHKGEQIGQAKTSCEKTIKERPFTSAAIAFAGGMLLSHLLKRH